MGSPKLDHIKNIPGLITVPLSPLPAGVYFLCLKDEIVYVGQSKYPSCRIHQHVYEAKKSFDSVYMLPVQQSNEAISELNNLESAFIRYLQPKFNGYGVNKKWYGAPKMTEDIVNVFERYDCKCLLRQIYESKEKVLDELRAAYKKGWWKAKLI